MEMVTRRTFKSTIMTNDVVKFSFVENNLWIEFSSSY